MGRQKKKNSVKQLTQKHKPEPEPQITEKDLERFMAQAPDYILEQKDEVKDLWVASEWAKEVRDTSPKRYYETTLNEGQENEKHIVIDFQQMIEYGPYLRKNGADQREISRVGAYRLQYLRLERDYQRTVRELNKAMGKESRRSRNIVDYTSTILELLGKFYTISDVVKVLSKEYKVRVPEDEVKKFYVENRDLITRRRAEYVLQNKDFRIATETGRLEVLNQMLVDAQIKNNQAGGTNLDYCNLILRIIEQARKEVKGNELKMTVDGKIDINASLHADSNVMGVMRDLSINSLVIGLTAAKAGLNPSVLIGQLANSWYARFNGFNGNLQNEDLVELPSALIKQYDWKAIEEGSRQFVKGFEPMTDLIDEQDQEKANTAEDVRRELLLKIKQAKKAKTIEESRANPNTPDSMPENGLVLSPESSTETPQDVFAVDYDKQSGGRYSGDRTKKYMEKKLEAISIEDKRKARQAKLKKK